MDAKKINDLLCNDVLKAVRFIFPNGGKTGGGRFTIGGIDGENGSSLYVYLSNGNWREASGGHPNGGGDLLELFCYKHGGKKEGLAAACKFLGVGSTRTVKGSRKSRKVFEINKSPLVAQKAAWKRPVKNWVPVVKGGKVDLYLRGERRISPSVMPNIFESEDGESYVFITVTHEDPSIECGMFQVGVKRELVTKKDGSKKFEKVITKQKGALVVLFGHESVIPMTNKDGKSYLIITEGQLDAATFRMHKFTNSVSIPSGGEDLGWIANSWDFINKFDLVYLVFDNDVAGDSFYSKIVGRIGAHKCRRVYIDREYGDPNDAHVKTKGAYNFQKDIDSAQEFKPETLVSAADLADETIARLREGPRHLQGIPFMGWTGEDSIDICLRPKEMTLWTGYPGAGKSNVIYQLIAVLIFCYDETVFIASLEEDMEDILGIIARHALLEPFSEENEWKYRKCIEMMREKLYVYKVRDRAKYKDLLEVSEYSVKRYGVTQFFLDSAAKTDLDIESGEAVSEFMGHFTATMNATDLHVHIVVHARKGDMYDGAKIPGLQEMKGSNQFGIEAFTVITIWRNFQKEAALAAADRRRTLGRPRNDEEVLPGKNYSYNDAKGWPDLKIVISKDKVGGRTGHHDAYYDIESKRIRRKKDNDEELPYVIIEPDDPEEINATENQDHIIPNF